MMFKLINQDCSLWLKEPGVYDCGFADPPDNIGWKYVGYDDNRPDYHNWLTDLIARSMIKFKVFWLCYNLHHDLFIKWTLKNLIQTFDRNVRQFIWNYEFGQNNATDNTNCFRPILRISHLDWKPILREKEQTERERLMDTRATGIGKNPGDVWHFSRIQGNNRERRSWHPTQLPEAIYQRVILQSVPENGTIVDLFAGTGTLFRTKIPFPLNKIGIEISSYYCEQMKAEHGLNVWNQSI